ncbi:DUF5686 and carboxypeptidase-like regulatory domain-containing protein [Capnocytophaga granulosa]|uniref:DUF5686 and carboxypeptidase-like regulatory domain-containing protein n=1 Tax=Capnocytophaga granulosa TaxID=45242 RepID=UPI0038577ABF
MMELFKRLCMLSLLFISSWSYAQTRVSGQVVDEQGEPVPFASVLFKNTKVGTACDENGKFSLYTQKNYNTLEVSSVGFTTKEITLLKRESTGLKIVLTEGEMLEEVVIVQKPTKFLSKKENPAYPILQKIWANKHKNSLTTSKSYEYKRYESVEMGLNNLDTVFLKKSMKKEYGNIRELLSSREIGDHYSLPMFLREEVSKVYGDNTHSLTRTDIEGERTQGVMQTGFGMERFTRNFRDFDIYDNSFYFLDKAFVSPLSEYGYGVYAYVLNDSIVRDGRKLYSIYFFPKEDQDLLFKGNFSVDSQTYAIASIQMFTIKEASLNFVRNLSIEKNFTVNDSLILPKSDYYEGDFTALSKSDEEKGLYVKKRILYSDFVLDQPKEEAFYLTKVEKYKSNQFAQDKPYWDDLSQTHSSLGETQELIKKVSDNKRIKGISNGLNILSSGYIPIGRYFQIGSIWESFSNNDIEGNRFRRMGARSFMSNDDRFRTYLYGAYGINDKKFKGGISGQYLVIPKIRMTIGGLYQDDYVQLGTYLQSNEAEMDLKNASNFLFSRGENYFVTRNKRVLGMVDFGLMKSNLHLTLSGSYQQMKSADPERFSIGYRMPSGEVLHQYSDAYASLSITYTPRRNVYGYGVEQFFGKNIFPTYRIKYTQAFSGIRNSIFDYSRLEAFVHHPIPLWNIGIFHPMIEVGKVFGTVPLPFLTPTPANQAYGTSRFALNRTFQLLNYYDFVTDAYMNVYLEHHFNGLIFNRIPLLKKTKWRSLILARMAYGTLSEENRAVSASNIAYNPPEKIYWEYGFGIENIGIKNLRPIRVDFIWRNAFSSHNGLDNPYFGVRFAVRPEF